MSNSKGPRQSILGFVGDAAIKTPLPYDQFAPTREAILEGSFYEIDHSKLPAKTPAMLHYVRAVMVTAKSEMNVTVRYPSAQSLEAYFGSTDHVANRPELYPALDEKFIMGPRLAADVLRRQIPSQGFEKLRHSKSFWLIKPFPVKTYDPETKHGPCFSKLQASGIGWGLKKLVAYVPNSKELDELEEVKSLSVREDNQSVKKEDFHEMKVQEIKEDLHETKVQEIKENLHETKVQEIIQYSRKRKRGRAPNSQKMKNRHNPKQKAIEVKAIIKGNNEKEFIDRWPKKRYEVAGMELVEVLKKFGANHDNPISRYKLRNEARKRIGDTGLLDHMLKHLAGKVVPHDGNDRLRRRCDTEGKMEYWLESADLVNIRKEAGIRDPYWIPPPGWKLGDSITDSKCLCRQEIKMLKDELNSMRREMAELKSKNKNEEPFTMPMPTSEASSGRETYEVLIKKKHLMEEQLHRISRALMELEDGKTVHSNRAEAAASLQLIPYACPSLPVEETNEDLEAAAVGELSDSHGEEKEESPTRRLIVKLRPCKRLDNFSSTSSCQDVDDSVQDLMAPTSTSGSPLSTTTS